VPSLQEEARLVLGGDLDSVTPLAHGAKLTVTREVTRVSAGGSVAFRKVIGPDGDPASSDPTHFRYWRREDLLYEQGLPPAYIDAGIHAPVLLGRFEQPDGSVALWLSEARGRAGSAWAVEDFAATAVRLGRAQGSARPPSWPWLSTGFLRSYLDRWADADFALLHADAAWEAPLVREAVARLDVAFLRAGLVRLHESRELYLRWMSAAPETFCHLDFWPHNLFAADDTTTAIDWGFCGVGVLGEDVGNLVPDSVFDLLQPASLLGELDRAVFEGYVEGLRSVGWSGDVRLVRLAMCASAVKYCWLAPVMLARALRGAHHAYGGAALVDPRPQYAARFAGLAFLVEWGVEAAALASSLGLA
jgi:hypothetical protein